jgi:hypothetical protein
MSRKGKRMEIEIEREREGKKRDKRDNARERGGG